jgi:hypothetical protein
LVFAVCQFFDAMICYSFAPRTDPDGKFGVWDELRCGVEDRKGWLGRPEGPAVRLAAQTPDLLQGKGKGQELQAMIAGPVSARSTARGVIVTNTDPKSKQTRFAIRGIPTNGSDLCVSIDMLGAPMSGYPREMARFAQVGGTGGTIDPLAKSPRETGTKSMTWVNDRPFTSCFYFRDVHSESVNLVVDVEGTEEVVIRSVLAHAHPDACYRLFQRGIVLANPSRKPYEFDLRVISPGRSYRRFQAVATQDIQTNNGQPVDDTVELDERDALFLVRTDL